MFRLQLSERGIHPPESKSTKDCQTLSYNSFGKVSIAMSMHIGVPCTPSVKVGDYVCVGQKIADSTAFMSVPVHSSISGKVTAIREVVAWSGLPVNSIDIESDGLATVHESVIPPVINDRESFIKAIRESGLVGLGGASFPTHVKMGPPKGKEPDTLVINAAECEPFITSDYRQCVEHSDDIILGTLSVMKWLSIPRAIIGIEDNKLEAAKFLRYQIERHRCSENVSIKILKTMYPFGAEKSLIYNTTGRAVPAGGLPYDVKVLVLNVGTVCFLEEFLRTGMPLVRKNLTLDGDALVKPCNMNVPVGALISDIIEASGGLKEEPSKVMMGGPMMGIALDRLDIGIVKANNAILVMDSRQAYTPPENPCIRCSRCIDACPMMLLPTTLDALTKIKDVSALRDHNVMDCIECGCCSYVCPSKRYLVQSIRWGKLMVKNASVKK